MDAAEEISKAEEFSDKNASKIHERIVKRQQLLAEGAERRKEARQKQTVAGERSEVFLEAFNAERAGLEQLLSGCLGAERTAVTRDLEEAAAKMAELQKLLNDSMMFLNQYEIRVAQSALQKLQASLSESREQAMPKKKFNFRSRSKAAEKNSAPPPAAPPAVTEADGAAAASQQPDFSHISDQLLEKTSEEIQSRDVLLTHLTNCKVRLYGSPSTLHLKHLHGCEVLCGPVATSVFVDHCTNSVLAFPCQQLRTHNTSDTQVYLHVTSRAIIEDCRGVGFAPFSWSYPTLDQDFSSSGLDPNRNNWSQVDDFNWLAAGTPSPNWTVIPEADRKTTWDP
ncbi:tubulin-specific chaperone C [Cyprinodon tularosa]|uniref:tubulin-specific chaperone C n=1 Tax=Cyprinodon tularosa TaxID=77115 RepID=UPI0018E25B27|nr:tubulin-specific chaperone C [Cyprinodon tularosa]